VSNALIRRAIPVKHFLAVVAVIETVSLRLAALILLLVALWKFIRHEIGR
jgi:hypothetical protein